MLQMLWMMYRCWWNKCFCLELNFVFQLQEALRPFRGQRHRSIFKTCIFIFSTHIEMKKNNERGMICWYKYLGFFVKPVHACRLQNLYQEKGWRSHYQITFFGKKIFWYCRLFEFRIRDHKSGKFRWMQSLGISNFARKHFFNTDIQCKWL